MHRPKEKIFVLMPTFNQVNFLQAAVEGVMSQVVDLPILLVIRDDASTDGTQELAKKLASSFPGRIELIFNEKNLYYTGPEPLSHMLREILLSGGKLASRFWLQRLLTKRAAFIALCEGDDYWTDSNKLQEQLEVFRGSKSVHLVHHDVDIVVETDGSIEYGKSLRHYLENFDLTRPQDHRDQFREGHNVMTCSAMFRLSSIDKKVLADRPPGLPGDWILFALISRKSRPHYIKKRMAAYRVHGQSFWSSMDEEKRARLRLATQEFLHPLLR